MNSLTYAVGRVASTSLSKFRKDRGCRSQILMYHSIGGSAEGDLHGLYSINDSMFFEQMRQLQRLIEKNELKVVPFGTEVEGALSITFDDGYRDNLTSVLPVMEQFGFPFHIFLNPTFVRSGRSDFLNEADVKTLNAHPLVTLGVHGYSHKPLGSLSYTAMVGELTMAKSWLGQLSGKTTESLSYPHGSLNNDVVTAARATGFKFGACSKFGPIPEERDDYRLPRIDIWSKDHVGAFTSKLRGGWDWMKWRT